MKARIVENTLPSGRKSYTIQQRHFLFWWWWVPAWANSWAGATCNDTWNTLKEAEENLCWFDGTKTKRRVPPARIAKAFMVVDGEIVEITEEHIRECFRNCTTLTTLSSFQMPDSITSAAFDLESNDQGEARR